MEKKTNKVAEKPDVAKLRFQTTILQSGKPATGIRVPDDIVDILGAGKKPPVLITLNGSYTYRNTIASMGGVFMVGVGALHRENSGVKGGDKVYVDIALDTKPREVVIPEDFQKALTGNKNAKKNFDALSFNNKQRYVLPIEGAKAIETRTRRISKAISELQSNKA